MPTRKGLSSLQPQGCDNTPHQIQPVGPGLQPQGISPL